MNKVLQKNINSMFNKFYLRYSFLQSFLGIRTMPISLYIYKYIDFQKGKFKICFTPKTVRTLKFNVLS